MTTKKPKRVRDSKPRVEANESAAVWVATDSLKPWDKNPRKNAKAIPKVVDSIRRFGFGSPIVARARTREIIAGHTRWEAAKVLALDLVPVRFVDLSEADAHAMAIADNRLGEVADWDFKQLAAQLDVLPKELRFTLGFGESELAKIMKEEVGTSDTVPEPPKNPVTKPGQLWQLGKQRILCGDSTSRDDVGRLFGKEKASLMATDPPYGIDYGKLARGLRGGDTADIENDGVDGVALQDFLERSIRAALPHLIDNPAFYLWHPMLTQGSFFAAAAAAAADIVIHRQIVWVKPGLILGRGDFHWRHELAFYGWIKGKRCRWMGQRDESTIWEIGREKDGVHPTQKPVELFAKSIRLNTLPGEVCYEPFSGSGSQILAAEALERRCFAIDIHPGYVDVAIQRWEEASGGKAKRI